MKNWLEWFLICCGLLIVLLVFEQAYGQVPQGLTAIEDTRKAPELGVLLYWQPVTGATSYNVYQAVNPELTADKCPAVLPFDDSTAVPVYPDDPNPGWYRKPIKSSGPRVWCYAVSAIVNGVESAKTAPVSIAIGNSGYVFWSLKGKGTYSPTDPCAAGANLPLPSTNLADYKIQFYYAANGSTVRHFFQTLNFFERNELAIVWHAPAVATDGSIIPWDDSGKYVAIISPPGSRTVEVTWNPYGNGIARAFYTQVSAWSLVDPGQPDNEYQCADSYFAQYNLWQNVTE